MSKLDKDYKFETFLLIRPKITKSNNNSLQLIKIFDSLTSLKSKVNNFQTDLSVYTFVFNF